MNKAKVWNSVQQKFEPDSSKVPISQSNKPYAQSSELYLKVVAEDTKEVILEQAIRHDTILG